MFKWFGNFVDSHDKELDRLRKIVDQVNDEVVALLQGQLSELAAMREELNGIVHTANADAPLAKALATTQRDLTAELKRLIGETAETRRTIEQGDTGARALNTLVATRKEMVALDVQRQKPGAGRIEIEEDLLRLRRDVQDSLRVMAGQNAKLAEVTTRLPEPAPLEMKPGDENKYFLGADALSKLVDQVEERLGPEIRGYFERLNVLSAALGRAVALRVLLGDESPGRGAAAEVALGPALFGAKSSEGRDLAGPLADLRTATRNLVDSLVANDLMKHLQRQGLLLPAELLTTPGERPQAPQQAGGGGLFRRNKQAAPAVAATPGPVAKDDLADLLTWQEAAVEEYFMALDQALTGTSATAVAAELTALRGRFQGFEGRLASRMAYQRGVLLAARTTLWDEQYNALSTEIGAEVVAPFFGELDELNVQQAQALADLEQDRANGHNPPIAIKPPYMGELMNRRDKIIADGFRRLIAGLRADGERETADRVKAVETEFRAAERKQEEELLVEMLPEVFASVWESARRTIGLRPADVQFMGGTTLHEGKISEMRTGEGKTLTSTLALSLNALPARGTHLVTTNEYLVQRDSDWMGAIYAMLGLTVGAVLNDMHPIERVAQYQADITYGTNSEFGFDYLRDNTAQGPEMVVQRPHHYCIVDEVDNILIDEARTPLIISGQPQQTSDVHERSAAFARHLRAEDDYTMDEKARSVVFTEEGIARAERYFNLDNLYHPDNFMLVYGLDNALRAHAMFKRDKDYVLVQGDEVLSPGVKPNPKQPIEVVIVDEFTGRMMPGRRYSEGLHEAIEAKEGITVRGESMTYATITIQNYFRLYPKLAGMTGTALTEAEEFYKIYKLEVTGIPTRLPMIRQDFTDRVYRTEAGKFRAVVQEIKEETERGRPVLVGTVSIEKSEELSKLLDEAGIPHTLLNAKQHEREASIVAQAGQKGAVTISTNMAGRGTDITLGFGVAEVGGMHIIGTERHESRRIDNQLRGRAGRQGDPGSSRFYVSMEDEIMRRSGMANNVVNSRLFSAVWEEDQPIEYNMVSKSVEQAQTKMEGFNFDTRKHLVEYDDVVNTQRDVIYKERRYVLLQGDPQTIVRDMLVELVDDTIVAAASTGPDGRPIENRKRVTLTADQFFDAMGAAFSDEVMNRLQRNLLRDYVGQFVEAGDRAVLGAEIAAIAQEAYENYRDVFVGRYDGELQKSFHIGDPMYENVTPDVDFNKLLRTYLQRDMPIPPDISGDDLQGMDYDEARRYFAEFGETWYESTVHPRLDEVEATLADVVEHGDAIARLRLIRETRPGPDSMPHPAEDDNPALAEAGALVDIVNSRFPVAAASAAARIAPGDELIDTISDALDELYAESESMMGAEFKRREAGTPLVGLAGTRIQVSAYREIEQQIGVEKLEEIESTPLSDVDPEIQELFVQAFLQEQEGRWILRAVDDLWTRHLTGMEALRESIGLQAYAQRDPLVEYKRNAYELFADLKRQIRQVAIQVLSLRLAPQEQAQPRRATPPTLTPAAAAAAALAPADAAALVGAGAARSGNGARQQQQQGKGQRNARGARSAAPVPAAAVGAGVRKVGRNDPCPCGSGKKYKMCHGR